MASVAQVLSWRVRPGRRKDFIRVAANADRILRRLGATTRTLDNVIAGEMAGTMTYVIESADMNKFAALQNQMQTDKEWQAFIREMESDPNPTADLIETSLYSEIAE